MDNEITINGVTYIRKDKCNCPFMNNGKKYDFTGRIKNYNSHILHQIIALKDFGNVKKGDIGGWIEDEKNLSQVGNAWVYGDARVLGNARVYGNAFVCGDAMVFGDARVFDNAMVYGDAWVFGNASVFGDARVYGDAWVCGDCRKRLYPLKRCIRQSYL